MKHRSKILTWAYWLASREAAAIFVLMGIISQFAHVYFITYEISSLPGIWRILQAIIMSFFFSCGLAFFILRGVKEDDYSTENERSKRLIVLFTWIEALINFAYWGGHLVYEPYMTNAQINWFQFIISIPFAVLIPVLLKAYGFSVLVNEPSIEEPEEVQEAEDIQESNEEEPEVVQETEVIQESNEESLQKATEENQINYDLDTSIEEHIEDQERTDSKEFDKFDKALGIDKVESPTS